LVLGLGYVPGVCWQILGFKHQTKIQAAPNLAMLSQCWWPFLLITDP